MDLRPVTLEGRHVRLEPLSHAHHAGLCEAAREWGLSPDRVREGIAAALEDQAEGTSLPFATIDRASGLVAGGTRFLRIVPEHRRLEIGSTWLGRPWRRTGLNTEAKLLMLRHAFEALGCLRVEFQADALNETSRAALRRIGATEEATLRRHRIDADGLARDMVYYSIIDAEWPGIRAHLEHLLNRPR